MHFLYDMTILYELESKLLEAGYKGITKKSSIGEWYKG